VIDRHTGHRREAGVVIGFAVATAHGVIHFRARLRPRPAYADGVLNVARTWREETDLAIGALESDDAAAALLAILLEALGERFSRPGFAVDVAAAVRDARAVDVAGEMFAAIKAVRR